MGDLDRELEQKVNRTLDRAVLKGFNIGSSAATLVFELQGEAHELRFFTDDMPGFTVTLRKLDEDARKAVTEETAK